VKHIHAAVEVLLVIFLVDALLIVVCFQTLSSIWSSTSWLLLIATWQVGQLGESAGQGVVAYVSSGLQ
jgi:arginine exporter protein ArgO